MIQNIGNFGKTFIAWMNLASVSHQHYPELRIVLLSQGEEQRAGFWSRFVTVVSTDALLTMLLQVVMVSGS